MAEVLLRGTLECVDDEQAARVERNLPDHIAATRAEPGCVRFDVEPIPGTRSWRVEERFANEAAFAAHQRRASSSEWGLSTAGIARSYVREQDVLVGSELGDIPGTFVVPVAAEPVGAVLLLHGTASDRDEVAGAYRRLAGELAGRGLASLRVDFAGCGASERPQTAFTVSSQVSDARSAAAWLGGRPEIDSDRVGVIGFSQGGVIAILLAGAEGSVAALATWSSGLIPEADRVRSFAHLFANGEAEADFDMGFTTFRFSSTWWDEFRTVDIGAAVDRYPGPVLAVCGSDDEVVSPSASADVIERASDSDTTLIEIRDADHIFNALDPDRDRTAEVVAATADWFASRLAS